MYELKLYQGWDLLSKYPRYRKIGLRQINEIRKLIAKCKIIKKGENNLYTIYQLK